MAPWESEWVVNMNFMIDEVGAGAVDAYWEKRSIYKISPWITSLSEAAFMPQVASFGPYHHERGHLRPMELHKEHALLQFLVRSGQHLDDFMMSIHQVMNELQDSYDQLESEWKLDTERFLKMMILDGCFMLELLCFDTNLVKEYASNDPIFSARGKVHAIPLIKKDMLMIENQLPVKLLDTLIAAGSVVPKDGESPATQLIARSFFSKPFSQLGDCFHALDVYRKNLLMPDVPLSKGVPDPQIYGQSVVPSAAALDEAGVLFERSKTFNLRDISFEQGVLRLPTIKVDYTTEPVFLNLMAFELFRIREGRHVTSYIFFMKALLDTERDVAVLVHREIIDNSYGSNKDVADLFNRLSRYISFNAQDDPYSDLPHVHTMAHKYQKKPWNQWQATLRRVYFGNPWLTISVIGAFSLFVLTLMQTIYSALSYYKPDSTQPPKM